MTATFIHTLHTRGQIDWFCIDTVETSQGTNQLLNSSLSWNNLLQNSRTNIVTVWNQIYKLQVSADSILSPKLTAASEWFVFFYILTLLKQTENQCRTSKGCCILIKSLHLQQGNANACLSSCWKRLLFNHETKQQSFTTLPPVIKHKG